MWLGTLFLHPLGPRAIIRNSDDDLKVTVHFFYVDLEANMAEILAILEGIQLITSSSCKKLLVECLQVINLISSKTQSLSEAGRWTGETRDMSKHFHFISFIHVSHCHNLWLIMLLSRLGVED